MKHTIVVFAGAALVTACTPSLPSAAPGDQPTAAQSTGRATVVPTDGPAMPLIVDWQPEQRGDLEELVHDGIVVVAFDAKGFRLLKGCSVPGDYGFVGMSMKTQVIRLESQQEVAANLPLAGVGIAGKIGGELESGTTLDIAMAMIGKKRTTWKEVAREDLQGGSACEGATHFVRGMTVGAFAMKTGSKQKASAAVEIFGIGASGGTASSKGVDNSDGKLAACDGADPDGEGPPKQCAALIRLEIEPITATRTAVAAEPSANDKPDVASNDVAGCPRGMVQTDGKCTLPQPSKPHVCAPGDAADCRAQCDKGNAPSCNVLGVMIMHGKAGGPPDASKARTLFDKACAAGLQGGCANASVLGNGQGPSGPASPRGLEDACRAGETQACSALGFRYRQGIGVARDPSQALKYYTKGCNGGDQVACTNLSVLYSGSGGIPRDDKRALDLAMRACFGGVSTSCGNAGLRYEFGMGVPADMKRAATFFDRACKMSKADCFRLGILHQEGQGVSKDDDKAKELFDASCKSGRSSLSGVACYVNEKIYRTPPGKVDASSMRQVVDTMQGQCDQRVARACSFLGVAKLALAEKPAGFAALKKGCDMKDAWACDLGKRLR
ncbi:MAG: tetratricopeptide repeat protein [Polyangiaceae bacterium]